MTGAQLETLLLGSAHWLEFAPTLIIIGVAGVLVVTWRARGIEPRLSGASERIAGRAMRAGAWAALALVAALAAKLFAQTYSSFGLEEPVTWRLAEILITKTTWGDYWIVQVVAAGAMWAGFAAARSFPALRTGVAMAAAAVVAVVTPLTGHAANRGAVLRSLHCAHVLGAGLWIGTLAVLIWTARERSMARVAGDEPAAFPVLITAFSPVALTGAALVAGSGAVMAWRHVQPWPAAWLTPFGIVLASKVGAVMIVAALGALNWRWLRPRLTRNPADVSARTALQRAAMIEAAIGFLLVLGLTAFLTGLPMPMN
jgi:putative copper export protein